MAPVAPAGTGDSTCRISDSRRVAVGRPHPRPWRVARSGAWLQAVPAMGTPSEQRSMARVPRRTPALS